MIFNMFKVMWFCLIFLLYHASCKPVERLPNPLPDEVYNKLKGILTDGNELKVRKDYDPVLKKLYRLISTKKYKIKKMENPLTGNEEDLIVFVSDTFGELIVPCQGDIGFIIKHYYEKYKGENRNKLYARIRSSYTGISCQRIQDWINHNREHFRRNPAFLNKDELKPVTAKAPWERLQVDFSKCKSRSSGKTYSYVLAVLDVFSRFLLLEPIVKKEPPEIITHLRKMFTLFGLPLIVQTDRGSEFKGKDNL